MGVKKLFTFLNENNIYRTYNNLNNLLYEMGHHKNKTLIGVDANLFFYKYTHSYNNMLIGFFNQILKFLSNGICPLYIFDGGTIKEKAKTNIDRNNNKKNNLVKLEELKEELEKIKNIDSNNDNIANEEDLNILIEKTYKKTIKVSNKYIFQLTELLDLLNIPYIFAHGEGEYLAVLLNNYNIIDYFLTDDTDPIPAGINNIIKFNSGKITYLNTKDIYTKLDITKEQLINLCVLMGTDYSTYNIKKYKTCDLMEMVKTVEKIDNIYHLFNIEKEEFENIVNIYKNVSDSEKCYLLNDIDNVKVNIINNHNLGLKSKILKNYCNDFVNVLQEKFNSTVFKIKLIKSIKKSVINKDEVLTFLNNNIEDMSENELKNIEISLDYLNKFRNR
jgi:5'-3' exonuclease